jgi:hypothetical protein
MEAMLSVGRFRLDSMYSFAQLLTCEDGSRHVLCFACVVCYTWVARAVLCRVPCVSCRVVLCVARWCTLCSFMSHLRTMCAGTSAFSFW